MKIRTKSKKFIVMVLMTAVCVTCLSLGMANIKTGSDYSVASADSDSGIQTYAGNYEYDSYWLEYWTEIGFEWDNSTYGIHMKVCHDSDIGGYYLECTSMGASTVIFPDFEDCWITSDDDGNHQLLPCVIPEKAFFEDSVTSVTIGSSVIQIGSRAFYRCHGLKTLTIGESVTTLGRSYDYTLDVNAAVVDHCYAASTFYECWNLTEIFFNATAMKDLTYNDYVFYRAGTVGKGITLTIGANVTRIPAYLFHPYDGTSHRPYLKTVKFESGSKCTEIGDYAFYDCDNITSFDIPDSVVKIGSRVFYECSNLASVTIGSGVASIGSWCFYGCNYITSVYITDLSAWCSIDFNSMWSNPLDYNKNVNLYLNNEVISGDVVIPDGTKIITMGAFFRCKNITSIAIPDSVTSIGEYAFYYCTSLKKVNIPNSVTFIDYGAFYGCESLTSVAIPDSVVSMDTHVFDDCASLSSVTIGTGLTSISDYTFDYCTSLASITIPDSITSIGSYAFYACSSLKSITIPKTLTSIGTYAFYRCTSLSSAAFCNIYGWTVSKSGTEISLSGADLSQPSVAAEYLTSTYYTYTWTGTNSDFIYELSSDGTYYILTAYQGSDSSVVLESTHASFPVKEIAPSVFEGHTEITSITISENITTIGSYAFSGCTYVTSIYFNSTAMDDLANNNGVFYNAGKSSGNIAVMVGANVTRIPGYLFYPYSNSTSYTPKISSVTFESGSVCESIGEYAFRYCSSLSSVSLPSGLKEIGSDAFASCTGLTSVIIPDTVTKMDGYAFYNTRITDFTIPSGVTVISEHLIQNNDSLRTVRIEGDVTEIGDYAFGACTALTEIYFNAAAVNDLTPENGVFTSAGRSGSGITVTIGTNVTRIPAYLFYPTSESVCAAKIATVIFESGCRCVEIGAHAFYGVSGFSKLYVNDLASFLSIDYADRYANPLSVLSENGGTFYVDESKTTELNVKNTSGVTRIGSYALAYCTTITDVALGENVSYIGEHAFEGMSGLDSFTLSYYSGWTVYASSTLSSGTKITSGELEGSALTYFTSTYVSYVWRWDYVSNAAPVVECKEVSSGGYTSATFTVTAVVDASSSIWYIAYTDPSGITFTSYYDATWTVTPTVNGIYEFVAVDTDGFTSETYYIIFDNTAPELYLGGSMAWANYNSSEFSVLAVDNLDGDVKLYYSLEGENCEWILCDSNPYTVTPDSKCSTDGYWWFKAVDAAGNSTPAYRTVLDTVAVFGSWEFYDDMSLYFSFSAPSYTSWTCYVNGVEYSSGSPFDKDLTTYTAVLTSPNGSTLTAEKYLGHYFPDEGDVVDPTCQSMGYTVYTCVYCGETQFGNFLSACEHEYMEVTVDATCTTNGYSRAECIYCGGVKEGSYQTIYATGHKAVSGAYKAPTCTEAGYYGTVCEVCGTEIETTPVEALGHLLTTETVPSTCVSYGYSLTYCTRDGCDYSVKNALTGTDAYLTDHVYGDVLRVSATCTDDGYTYEQCTVCGYEHTTILHATGHDFGQYYEAEDTETGLVTRWHTCKTCGFTESFELTSNADTAANGVIDIFQKYQKYMWWILLAFVGIWSLFIGLRYALSRNDEEKVKAKSMLANYILGLFVIAIVLVGLPYLIYGIAILVG